MGLPTESTAPLISPQVVGNAFLEQYYQVLHGSPELFYRFYQDSSFLTRPDSHGVMKSVTTTQAINDLILSLDCKNYITEILSADSQQSYKGGVFIQATGYMTALDNIRQRFSQSFFLAPQDRGGYFVLNDVFRFVDDIQPKEVDQMLANEAIDAQSASLTLEQPVSNQDLCAANPLAPPLEEHPVNGEEPHDVADNRGPAAEEEITTDQPIQPSHCATDTLSEMMRSVVQEDLPKKSYASILGKGSTLPVPVYEPTPNAMPAATKAETVVGTSTTPASQPEVTTRNVNIPSEMNDSSKEGYSIFIRNLPLNATVPQVEEVLMKFGPIKPGGVQVKCYKLDRNCFGFVEFETLDSRQAAIEASSVMIGGCQAFIAEKKTIKRAVGGAVSSGSSNGGRFQNNNGLGSRGSFGGNQGGFTRNIHGGGGHNSGRGWGLPRVQTVQNGYSRMDRPRMTNQATAVV